MSVANCIWVVVLLVGSGQAFAAQDGLPRCRKYKVGHPVYSWDHRVWGVTRTLEKAEDWVGKSNNELRSHITEEGYWVGDNRRMVEVAGVLGRKYGETARPEYAYKAAVILHRYSQVISKWGWYEVRTSKKVYPHDVMLDLYGTKMPPAYAGFWSSWFPYDLHQSAKLVLAYDQIYNSGQMEKLGRQMGQKDLKLVIERDLLYKNLAINNRYPLMYGNTEANWLLGMLIWGQAMGDPELVHRAIRMGDGLVKISYFPSAFWHEGTPSYHMMITGRWAIYYPMGCLASYSDPPGYEDTVDGTRFDNADFHARYKPFLQRAARQMQKWILPNGHYAAVHDTHWTDNTTDCYYGVLKKYKSSQSQPILHTWAGHAMLGRGQREHQVQAHLHFSGTYGHEHKDSLNFFLWAKNKELLSETDYGAHGHRAWGASTAGHNTVVVDEKNQFHRSSAPQREFSEIDKVPGVEDFWFARTHLEHGTCLTDGMLRLFATDCPGVQVVEADGHRSYPSDLVKLYRRTLVMVESGDEDVYLVDIFRVRGGRIHDWMLHGPLQDEYTVKTSLQLKPREGKLHRYLERLRSATTDNSWWVEFSAATGETVRTTMMAAPGTKVTLGQGPAMRHEGAQTFLDARRTELASVFVAVHEPYVGRPRVRSAELVRPRQASEMAVMVKVELANRTDYILSTLGEEGTLKSNDLDFRGHFGYVCTANNEHQTLYMADASLLRTNKAKLHGPAAYTGTVTQTLSTARGDGMNAFVTNVSLPSEGLSGKLLLITDGDGSTRGFWVKSIKRHDNRTFIQVDRIPGMTIEEGHVKLQYFPNWGIAGGLDFRILNSARAGGRNADRAF